MRFLNTKIKLGYVDIYTNSYRGVFFMERLTISAIKRKLTEETVDDAFIESLSTDPRKGVQQAVKVYQNKLAKQHELITQYQTMKKYENECRKRGKQAIAGIDEVGRGPLAGPVVAAAVILPEDFSLLGLTDSKKLNRKQRESFAEMIKKQALAIGIGVVDHETIDQYNIYQASIMAMKQAVEQLNYRPDHLLIDAVPLPDLPYSSDVIIKGDQKSISIAAASVIAKVHRDQIMAEFAQTYPGYQFEKNQGYGTKNHLLGIENQGITPIHRKSFEPVKSYVEGGRHDGTTIF